MTPTHLPERGRHLPQVTLSTLVTTVSSPSAACLFANHPLRVLFLASVAVKQQAQGEPLGTETSSGVSVSCQCGHKPLAMLEPKLKLVRACQEYYKEAGEDRRKLEGPSFVG